MIFRESSYLHYWDLGNLAHFVRIRAGWVLSVEKFARFQGTHIGVGSRTYSKQLQLNSVSLSVSVRKEKQV